ncbi:MAG TPA: hypothetical protein DEH78_29350 [Solibacterales bacterium]|nr:hypothetical protein [Bryobacterales bacterium]
MLDHALRRVSVAHSWVRRAEATRRFLDSDAEKLKKLESRAPGVVQYLDRYCEERSVIVGSLDDPGYSMRRRAVEGWKEIVREWSKSACDSPETRIAAVRELQSSPEIEKFGDIHLFEHLAADAAVLTWRTENGSDPSLLEDYVAGRTAQRKKVRYKVPAYCHPDHFHHPVYCDFGNSRCDIDYSCRTRRGPAPDQNVTLDLWNGAEQHRVLLRWSSKRLVANLGLDQQGPQTDSTLVTRADRLGRRTAAAGPVRILNIFDEKDWNGRLQVPRRHLERLARLESLGHYAQVEILRNRLPWFLTFSPSLQPTGPFFDYAASHRIAKQKDRFRPNAHANKGRSRNALLQLCRLPNLRVLSVDLGHRYAAACAVWETCSANELQEEIKGAKIVAGGAGPDHIYLHVRTPNDVKRIYRRVAGDCLADGKPHPAPWARLDRQFVIRLQGEDRLTRAPSADELIRVTQWEEELGRSPDPARKRPYRRVDECIQGTLDLLRRALRRHGQRARVAFFLRRAAACTEPADRHDSLTKALIHWHALISDPQWTDQWAESWWKQLGLPLPASEVTGMVSMRRGQKGQIEGAIRARSVDFLDHPLESWSQQWSASWDRDDMLWSGKDGLLATMRQWVAPRGLRSVAGESQENRARKQLARLAARGMGGLSVTRVGNLTALYRLLKAHRMRPRPAYPSPQNSDCPESLEKFNLRLLTVRDRLRDQRVKQLVSRLIEAALGMGRMPRDASACKSPARPLRPIDPPCHAIVIESLRYYRPDEANTRRENRMLMEWSSGKVRKLLEEACVLHGLFLHEVNARYTSRQCSRTGLPGLRCSDIPIREFLSSPHWISAVHRARENLTAKDAAGFDRYLLTLADRFTGHHARGSSQPSTVRLPVKGGDLFVAADEHHHPAAAIQADLNGAANVGLRALFDPDWPGAWWFVSCDPTGAPSPGRVKGCEAFVGVSTLPQPEGGQPKETRVKNEFTYLWRDPAPDPLCAGDYLWRPTRSYWNSVEERVLRRLNQSLFGPEPDSPF